MNEDDLKYLAILINLALEYPSVSNFPPNYREPGMGTDYDCRIGEFLIKKRRNPYAEPEPASVTIKHEHCSHESMSYIGNPGAHQWKCFKCGYVTPS